MKGEYIRKCYIHKWRANDQDKYPEPRGYGKGENWKEYEKTGSEIIQTY